MSKKIVAPCGRSSNCNGKDLTVETLTDHVQNCPACVALRDGTPFDMQHFNEYREKSETDGRHFRALAIQQETAA